MADKDTQTVQWQQKQKQRDWRTLAKASEAKAAREKAREARKNADYWDSLADQKIDELHKEVSKQYQEKDE